MFTSRSRLFSALSVVSLLIVGPARRTQQRTGPPPEIRALIDTFVTAFSSSLAARPTSGRRSPGSALRPTR